MTHERYEVAVSGERAAIVHAVGAWAQHWETYGAGATILPSVGAWAGETEAGALVRFDWPVADGMGPVLFSSLLETLAVVLSEERFFHVTPPIPVGFVEWDAQLVRDSL